MCSTFYDLVILTEAPPSNIVHCCFDLYMLPLRQRLLPCPFLFWPHSTTLIIFAHSTCQHYALAIIMVTIFYCSVVLTYICVASGSPQHFSVCCCLECHVSDRRHSECFSVRCCLECHGLDCCHSECCRSVFVWSVVVRIVVVRSVDMWTAVLSGFCWSMVWGTRHLLVLLILLDIYYLNSTGSMKC